MNMYKKIIAITIKNDRCRWHAAWCLYNNHRENDRSAIICSDGKKEWWVNDKLHRENDQPAIVYSDGTKGWWVNDKLHRENGQPAVIFFDGHREWWIDGVRVG